MEKKRAIWLGLALLVMAGGLTWYINRSREPMYEGKPLTYWLASYGRFNRTEASIDQANYALFNRTEASFREADHALETIGTNAIPTLLEMTAKTDSPLKFRLINLLQKQRLINLHFHSAVYYQTIAMHAFDNLRLKNHQTIPTIASIFKNSHSQSQRRAALSTLRYFGPNAGSAVPTLAACLADPNEPNKLLIINDLFYIQSHPEIAVPSLINSLGDSNLVGQAAVALSIFRDQAKQAVPVIEQKLKQSKNPATQQLLLYALNQIDPQTAAQFQSETNHANSVR